MRLLQWVLGKYRKLSIHCPACGALAGIGYTFCPVCSTRLDQGFLCCPGCKRSVEPGAKFCPHCQTPVSPDRARMEATTIVWRRQTGQFARKIDLNHEVFKEDEARIHGFLVEYGTQALLIVDGTLAGVLESGRYPQYLGKDGLATKARTAPDAIDLITKAQKFVSCILIQQTDQDLKLVFGLSPTAPAGAPAEQQSDQNILLTSDNLRVGVDCQLTLRLRDARSFYENLMGAREIVLEADLKSHFYSEIRDAIRQTVRGQQAEPLIHADRALRDTMGREITEILQTSFRRTGLELVQVRSVFVAQAEVRALVEKRGQVELGQKKLEVLKQAWALSNQEQFAQRANAVELERAMLALDRERVISREEYEDLKTAFAEGRGDRTSALAFLQKKLQFMYDIEYRRVQMAEEGSLNLQQIDIQLAKRRKELEFVYAQQVREAETKLAAGQHELDLWKQQNQALLDIERQKLDMNMAVQAQYMAKISEMKPETAGLFLSQNPEIAKVLIARAQAEGNTRIVEAYEKFVPHLKDVAALTRMPLLGAAYAPMGWGAMQMGAFACLGCGSRGVPSGSRFCPSCGKPFEQSPPLTTDTGATSPAPK